MVAKVHKHFIKARVREFTLPPINDGLVLGRMAPIGCTSFCKALELLVTIPFEHIEIEDEIIGDIVIRQAILRKVSREYLVDFVLQRIKPLMGAEEILHLDLAAEILIEEDGQQQ
jgi:hypothetical protein